MELYSAPTWVHYGQAYVVTGDQPLMEDAFAGQSNGLLGAGVPGALFLWTSTHTGEVPVRVRREDTAPDLDDAWEDVVEASVVFEDEVTLVEWGGQGSHPLDVPPGSYRARWSCRALDEARDEEPEEPPDAYELVLWPAGPAPDAVLRQTSDVAAYRHRSARGEPEPEPTVSPAARASREAWARLVDGVRAGQPLSGERGVVAREGVVPGTPPAQVFRMASRPYGWFGHGGSAPLQDQPGHEFTAFVGHLTMDGRYVSHEARRRTAVMELSFHWHEGREPLLTPPSVLRLAVTAEGEGSRVAVVHEDLPVEWLEAFGLLWDAQLARVAHWAEHGWTGVVPVEDS